MRVIVQITALFGILAIFLFVGIQHARSLPSKYYDEKWKQGLGAREILKRQARTYLTDTNDSSDVFAHFVGESFVTSAATHLRAQPSRGAKLIRILPACTMVTIKAPFKLQNGQVQAVAIDQEGWLEIGALQRVTDRDGGGYKAWGISAWRLVAVSGSVLFSAESARATTPIRVAKGESLVNLGIWGCWVHVKQSTGFAGYVPLDVVRYSAEEEVETQRHAAVTGALRGVFPEETLFGKILGVFGGVALSLLLQHGFRIRLPWDFKDHAELPEMLPWILKLVGMMFYFGIKNGLISQSTSTNEMWTFAGISVVLTVMTEGVTELFDQLFFPKQQ